MAKIKNGGPRFTDLDCGHRIPNKGRREHGRINRPVCCNFCQDIRLIRRFA